MRESPPERPNYSLKPPDSFDSFAPARFDLFGLPIYVARVPRGSVDCCHTAYRVAAEKSQISYLPLPAR